MSKFGEDIIARSYREEFVGKFIKSSKKKYTWDIEANGKPVKIVLARSKVSGKTQISYNEKVIGQSKNFIESA